MTQSASYPLQLTTQGPSYPPSEVMDAEGNFIVIGRVNRQAPDGGLSSTWSRAIVAADSPLPAFGQQLPYRIVRELPATLSPADQQLVLHTLPLPLPCSNYPMLFAPAQQPLASQLVRPSYAFHQTPIPDLREQDGRRISTPITLGMWVTASGRLNVQLSADRRHATFELAMTGLIPDSLYTVMSLRQHDLHPAAPTRPGPLGVPNVFMADAQGRGHYRATLPHPFPDPASPGANRVINVIVLWMSYQMNCGGAIGWFGLGGDIHAQLKLAEPGFQTLHTHP